MTGETSAPVLTVDEFWVRMCDPRFVRTGRLTGHIGGTVYVTLQAPEDVPYFIERKMASIRHHLA